MKIPFAVKVALCEYIAGGGDAADMDAVRSHLLRSTGQGANDADVRSYLVQKSYRDRRHSSRCRAVVHEEHLASLESLWRLCDGVCPTRQSPLLSEVRIPYAQVQQWFGQKRHARMKLPKTRVCRGGTVSTHRERGCSGW